MLTPWLRLGLILIISLTVGVANIFAQTSATVQSKSSVKHSNDSSVSHSKNVDTADSSVSNLKGEDSTDSLASNSESEDSANAADDLDQSETVPEDLPDSIPVAQKDPLEGFNRVMFKFNDFFDNYFLKPVSEVYSKVVPKPLVKGISNVFSNIDMVPTVLNDLLMANFYQATSDFWRLSVNTTLGIGGLFDVASGMGLEPNTEDFGLTLARWGWGHSTYIVIPFMGPSTIRDGIVGWPVNYYALSVYPYIRPPRLQFGIYALNVVSRRADLLHYQEVLDSVAIDKYAFMRNAYLQRRNYLIERNQELNDPYIGKNNLDTSGAKQEEKQAVVQTKPFSNI